MTTKDEALRMALKKAFDLGKRYWSWADSEYSSHWKKADVAKEQFDQLIDDTIREVLAQPEQEPVAWMYQDKSTHEVRFQKHMKDFVDHSKTSEVPLYSEPLANHELQCVCGAVWCGDEMVHLPNKTTPPHRKPLTDEEIDAIISNVLAATSPRVGYRDIARAIEQAHNIKE